MVQIDVVTGFLGAGKTTFCNALLRYSLARGEKAVYIVNEFGETELDAEIIRREGFEAKALANGCICCTLRGELTVALKEIVQEFAPDRIVFETSGVFVFDQFMDILKDELLSQTCAIHRTITIIDSVNYKKERIIAGSFIENQIKNASLLVLSKLERFCGDVTQIVCDLANINPEGEIFAVPWDGPGFMEGVMASRAAQNPLDTHAHLHAHLNSVTLKAERAFTAESYENLKDRILAGEFGVVLRAKGYILLDGRTYLLNIALDDAVLKEEKIFDDPMITLIGSHLELEKIKDAFGV